MKKLNLVKYFNKVETTREHNAYTHSVGRTLTIVILGFLCKLQDVDEIQQWAEEPRTREFLSRNFAIYTIPTSRRINEILSIVNPESLNEIFIKWTTEMLPEFLDGLTIAFDGKTICSTGKMSNYDKPLHILSAYLCESGLTIGQKTVDEKSNEIPAMRELIKLMDIRGSMVVADALHCQTETAAVIIENGGDYLLNAKGNQEALENDIRDFVQDETLRAKMETEQTCEKNGGRIEIRTAFVSNDISWMEEHLPKWLGLSCFGAINRCFTTDGKTSNEWHYYISSRKLTAKELLTYARNEWAIESMHWLLDVHFDEDSCRTRNSNSNQNLNIFRKTSLNYVRHYKNHTKVKTPMSKLMFACLLDCHMILKIINFQ
jgi:predicted transposase YbfD/YdcC